MPTKSPPDMLVVFESFIGSIDGAERVFRKGDLIRPTDPAVKKWPAYFESAEFTEDRGVEQATAAPGEKRG